MALAKAGSLAVAGLTRRVGIWSPYVRAELRPPSPGELAELPKGFQKLAKAWTSGAWKSLTVRQAALNTLVGMEIAGWFFIGECIGKGRLIGYVIPAE